MTDEIVKPENKNDTGYEACWLRMCKSYSQSERKMEESSSYHIPSYK